MMNYLIISMLFYGPMYNNRKEHKKSLIEWREDQTRKTFLDPHGKIEYPKYHFSWAQDTTHKCYIENTYNTNGIRKKEKEVSTNSPQNWTQYETLSLVKVQKWKIWYPQERSAKKRHITTKNMFQSKISLKNIAKRPRFWNLYLAKIKIPWEEVTHIRWRVYLHRG